MDNDTFAVIDHGGMLDLSQQTFMVPAERKALDRRGRVMLLGLTQQDTNAMPQMDAAEGQEISAGEIVRTSEACQQQ